MNELNVIINNNNKFDQTNQTNRGIGVVEDDFGEMTVFLKGEFGMVEDGWDRKSEYN